MVDQPLGEVEWKDHTTGTPRDGDRDEHVEDGLGSVFQRRLHSRLLVSERENSPHQCTRIYCSKIWCADILQEQEGDFCAVEVGQLHSGGVCQQDGGGTESPLSTQLVKELWQWCLQWDIHLRAQHLPGKLNFTADFLSRHLRDRSDWILDEELFSMINSTLGPLDIDLFATRFSARLPGFVSRRPDPIAEATDAFLQDWSTFTGYAHPPWCLISQVLFKARSQMATLVVVVPLWQTQPWFPQLLQMLIDTPILLPQQAGVIEPSPNCDCPIMNHLPQLIAFKVSGCASKQKEFQYIKYKQGS